MKLHELLVRLNNVRQSGDEFSAQCPSHQDQRNSLSVAGGEKGIVLCCHAGCSTTDICSKLGLQVKELFCDEEEQKNPLKPRIVATYDYCDEQGKLLYQNVRFLPKDFRHRRPEAGDWVWNLKDVRRVLYRLPELLSADTLYPVFVVEGEKDVESLRSLGQIATTSSGGAKSWKECFADFLKGRNVVIIPDNDQPGREYAEWVARSAMGKASAVKIIHLEGLPEHGDISDWLNGGHTLSELMALVSVTEPWIPPALKPAVPVVPVAPVAVEEGIPSEASEPDKPAESSKPIKPPVSEYDSQAIFAVISGMPQSVFLTECSYQTDTDMGNAARFSMLYRDNVIYSHERKRWYLWTGKQWKEDIGGSVVQAAKDMVNLMRESFKDNEVRLKHAQKSQSCNSILSCLCLAQSEKGIPFALSKMDHDPWVINCLNGVLCLRTGQLKKVRREDYLSKLVPANYNPMAKSTLWSDFLQDTCQGDSDMIRYLQKAAGASIVGVNLEEQFYFISGPGGTGKSTFLETIETTLGDYAVMADFSTFLQTKQTGPRNDIARLSGARMVISIEMERKKHMAQSLIKQLTGRDTVTARFLFKESFEFKPQFKIWLSANDCPVVDEDDDALWRRLIRIPFDHVIPREQRRPEVKSRLTDVRESGEAILAWLVEGCFLWQQEGLEPSARILDSIAEYRAAMNLFKDFFDEALEFDKASWCSAKALAEAYRKWTRENNEVVHAQRLLGLQLGRQGCEKARRHTGHGWTGVRIRPEFETTQGNYYERESDLSFP